MMRGIVPTVTFMEKSDCRTYEKWRSRQSWVAFTSSTMSESDPLELTSLDTESLLTALLNAEKVRVNHRMF